MGVMMIMLLSLKRAILVDIFYRGVSSDQITPNLADCEKILQSGKYNNT
jgi:hypothetical protein